MEAVKKEFISQKDGVSRKENAVQDLQDYFLVLYY